jgi:ketosteroid isomerase-like protein
LLYLSLQSQGEKNGLEAQVMDEEKNRQEVLDAADSMILAFSKHDRENYFAAFSEQATFYFHNLDRLLKSRAEYESEWKTWERVHQFHIRACRSSERNIQMLGNVAVFTHEVSTDINFDSEQVTSHERETIIFACNDAGRWLGVHEHLSICDPL